MMTFFAKFIPGLSHFGQTAGTDCTVQQSVFGIPTWYKYLPGQIDPSNLQCQVSPNMQLSRLDVLLGIGIAFIEILLRVAAFVAIAYIIYAGFVYLTSNGDPERAKSGKDTILNALIGLVIAIMATVIVGFIGQRLTS